METNQQLTQNKDEYVVIMLCKRWTSMISANFFRNAKSLKNITLFFLKLMNTNVWIPHNLNNIEKVLANFLSVEGEIAICYTSQKFVQGFWARKSCKFFPWFQIFTKKLIK